jgi:hypothetical protein
MLKVTELPLKYGVLRMRVNNPLYMFIREVQSRKPEEIKKAIRCGMAFQNLWVLTLLQDKSRE